MSEGRRTSLDLAGQISDCREVVLAFKDSSHACRDVIAEQTLEIHDKRQRPEPWFGNLEAAKLLFVSSNPSINTDEGQFGEVFPTYDWSVEDSAKFFVDRVTEDPDSPVTFAHPKEPNFLTRSHDGEYRTGLKNPKKPQTTWNMLHHRAQEILGSGADPRKNYALTEVVHCKSRSEAGVKKAASFCTHKWMEKIVSASASNIIVILGSQARDSFAIPVLGAPTNFGASQGYGDLSDEERFARDVFTCDFGGKKRLVIFNWHPNNRGFNKILSKVYGETGIAYFKRVANGEVAL